MPDPQNAGGMPAQPPGDPAQGQTPSAPQTPGGEPGSAAAPSVEELQAQIEKMQAALKVANKSDEQRRKKLEAYEAEEQKRQEAALSEAEKLKKRIAELEQSVTARESELKSHKLRGAVSSALAGAVDKAKITFASETAKQDALDLLMAQVSLSEDGKVDGFDDAFKELQKTRDYLFRSASAAPNIDASQRNSGQDLEARKKEFASRFRIPNLGV